MEEKKYHLFIFNSKFVRIFGYSVFLFSILLILSEAVVYEKDQRYEHAYNYSLKNDIDLVFLSNSYVFTGFDPLYFKEITGLNSVHLGHNGMGLIYHYVNLYNTLEKFSPKYIVLDVSPPSLNTILPIDDNAKFYAKKALVHSDISKQKLFTMYDIGAYNDLRFFFESLSPFTASLVNFKSIKYKTLFQNERINTSSFLGFQPLNNKKEKKDKLWENFDNFFAKKPNKNTPFIREKSGLINKYLLKILDYTKRKGVKIIFVNSIKYAPTRGLYGLDSLLSSCNYDHAYSFDMNSKRDLISFSKNDFSDMTHLNHSGALKQTKVFSNFINEEVLKKKSLIRRNLLDDFGLKSFNFVADLDGGFLGQVLINRKKSLHMDVDINLEFYLKGGQIDTLKISRTNAFYVDDEIINLFDIPVEYQKEKIDSIFVFTSLSNPKEVKNMTFKSQNSSFTIEQKTTNTYEFKFIEPQKDKYEYVIYMYLNNKLIEPNHSYSVDNTLVFEAKAPIDQYHFKCYYRLKNFNREVEKVY